MPYIMRSYVFVKKFGVIVVFCFVKTVLTSMSIIFPKIIIITDFFGRFCGIHISTMYFSYIERIPYVRGQLFNQFFYI